jgi:hypothetical protein
MKKALDGMKTLIDKLTDKEDHKDPVIAKEHNLTIGEVRQIRKSLKQDLYIMCVDYCGALDADGYSKREISELLGMPNRSINDYLRIYKATRPYSTAVNEASEGNN